MKVLRFLVALACTALFGTGATAQDTATSAAVALMDKMTGQWVMTGTISNKATTDNRTNDSWTWAIDNVDKTGTTSPFARLTLTRKR
jgi:hypothetical protein